MTDTDKIVAEIAERLQRRLMEELPLCDSNPEDKELEIIETAIREALSLSQPKDRGWIEVSPETMPKDGQSVWAYFPNYSLAEQAMRPCVWKTENKSTRDWIKRKRPEADVSQGLFDLEYTSGFHTADQITHWMPRVKPSAPPTSGNIVDHDATTTEGGR